MRTKEEIAQIADEITRNVHVQRALKEYYSEMVLNMAFFDPLTNTCFHSRIREVMSAHARTKEALERYREIVNITKAEEMGPSLEEFYRLLGIDATRYKINSVTGI